MALPHPYYNNPAAYMGFVGFVRLNDGVLIGDAAAGGTSISHGAYVVRATTADITLSQEISKPDVVDARYDKTIYQLGPKLVDGTLAFPAIYDLPTNETRNIFEILYRYAATRTATGNLNDFDLDVKYAAAAAKNQAEFTYGGCIVNTWQFSVTQSDVVNCSIDIIGLTRDPNPNMAPPSRPDDDDSCTPKGTGAGEIGTSRIVTWADARVEIAGGRLTGTVGGQYMRSFEANINNDAERFYTLNKQLFAQAVAPRKRDVDGNVVLMGRNPDLSNLALSNEFNCRESVQIKFGFVASATGEGCTLADFAVTIPNVVFEIEELSLTNDLFETTVNWHALPAAGTGVCDPLLSSVGAGTTFTY